MGLFLFVTFDACALPPSQRHMSFGLDGVLSPTRTGHAADKMNPSGAGHDRAALLSRQRVFAPADINAPQLALGPGPARRGCKTGLDP